MGQPRTPTETVELAIEDAIMGARCDARIPIEAVVAALERRLLQWRELAAKLGTGAAPDPGVTPEGWPPTEWPRR